VTLGAAGQAIENGGRPLRWRPVGVSQIWGVFIMMLRRIGVLSLGKIMGILYALIGLLVGGMMALISLLGLVIPQQQNAGDAMMGMLFGGVAALIFLPIFYGAIGFVGGIIMAFLYNLVAGMVGGLEFEFDRIGGPDYVGP
jgi:hypothetical protein